MFKAAEVTKQRLKALKRIAETYNLSDVVVFLLGDEKLKASYCLTGDDAIKEKLKDLQVTFSPNLKNDSVSYKNALVLETQRTAGKVGSASQTWNVEIFALPSELVPQIGAKRLTLGSIAYTGERVDISREDLELFALSISASRDHRIVAAVKSAQELLSEIDQSKVSVDDVLSRVALIVRDILGAQECFYKNENKFLHWKRLKPSELVRENTNTKEEFDLGHSLDIALSQPSFRLEKKAFKESSDFISDLKEETTNFSALRFYKKQNPGYLQRSFSQTDKNIAARVFGYLEHYASARAFQSNYHKVLQYLKNVPVGEDLELTAIHTLMRSLSISVTNVFLLDAEFYDGQIVLGTETSACAGEVLDEGYKDRVKRKYLKKYYQEFRNGQSENLQIGLDVGEGRYDIEVHFPSRDGNSKIYIVRYVRSHIPESVLRSLIGFFNELHVRNRILSVEQGRADYLTQVRHAVIHHFGAANKWISTLHPRWKKGLKNPSYWAEMQKDPIVIKSIKRTWWSLTQARLLLENGRFLLSDIETGEIDRKPFSITRVIQDSLTSLDDHRDHKSIVMSSSIIGTPPGLMNADDALMRIAILNLIDNAFKYSENAATVEWKLNFLKDRYIFSISNTGSFISDEQKELLQQVGVRGKQRKGLNPRHGTGLGLPVASKIIRAHSNGETDLRVQSDEIVSTNPVSSTSKKLAINTFSFSMKYLTGLSKNT